MYRNTYVQVNVDNLKYNVETLIKNYPDYQYYFGVVKGNAYGHSDAIVKYLIESGVNYLAVASLEEAVSIRNRGIKIPILCLEPIGLSYVEDCIRYDVTITVHDYFYLKELNRIPFHKNLKIHLKVDSGMNRLGFKDKASLKEAVDLISSNSNLFLEGIFTHFATSGIYDKHWDNQLSSFQDITSLIDLSKIPIVHLGRSLTLLNHSKIPFCNGIRLGIVMYGYNQTPKKGKGLKAWLRSLRNQHRIKKLGISPTVLEVPFQLKPAFQLFSEIIQIKKISKGEFVGYGASFVADKDMYVGVVPIGYADGFGRSNKNGFVVIRGKKYPIIGDINMGMITVALDETIQIYDKVVLIGDGIDIASVARHNHTTVYEIMCMLNNWVPRVLVLNGKIIQVDER